MKLRIDAEACTGHGRCYVLAPDVFDHDQLAAANCPESAITIVED